MPNSARLALLEAVHEAERRLTALVASHRDYHNAFVTNHRALARETRTIIAKLNSPPFQEPSNESPVVQQPAP